MKLVREPLIIGALLSLVVLGSASVIRPLAWPFWAAWAAMTAIGIWMVAFRRDE